MNTLTITGNRKWRFDVAITVRDLVGHLLEVRTFKNLIPTVGFNMMRDGLYGDVTDFQIKYTGVGDVNTAPALTDWKLGNETFRKAVTSRSKPAAGQCKTVQYIAPAEAVGWIKEIGWFAGATAGGGVNTGTLVARVLYSRNKTALESIQIERTDTFAEA